MVTSKEYAPDYIWTFLLTNVVAYQNNILISEDWHACLADFGLAGWADATLATSTSNHAGLVRWMAPELHMLKTFCRTKLSNVYAFACVSVEVSCTFLLTDPSH
jgi:serine/threonine protein kinase